MDSNFNTFTILDEIFNDRDMRIISRELLLDEPLLPLQWTKSVELIKNYFEKRCIPTLSVYLDYRLTEISEIKKKMKIYDNIHKLKLKEEERLDRIEKIIFYCTSLKSIFIKSNHYRQLCPMLTLFLVEEICNILFHQIDIIRNHHLQILQNSIGCNDGEKRKKWINGATKILKLMEMLHDLYHPYINSSKILQFIDKIYHYSNNLLVSRLTYIKKASTEKDS